MESNEFIKANLIARKMSQNFFFISNNFHQTENKKGHKKIQRMKIKCLL